MPQRLKGQVWAVNEITCFESIVSIRYFQYSPQTWGFHLLWLSASVVSHQPIIAICRKFNSKNPRQFKNLAGDAIYLSLSPSTLPRV